MQLFTVVLLLLIHIPPPANLAELPLNVQLVIVGLPPLLAIPPPVSAEFPLKEQLTSVGLLPWLYIPPPEG
jgi:hypothetical protein